MMLGLDKASLLIGFYLCLHFHYCFPEQQTSSIRNLHSEDSSRALSSSNAAGSETVNSSNETVYKCLGRMVDTGEQSVEVPGPFMSDNITHIFQNIKRKELNCKKGRFKIIFQVEEGSVKVLKTDSKSRQVTSYEDPTIRIMKDGAYLHVSQDFFHPTEYCFDQIEKSELSLFVCYPECFGQRPCVTKCCPQDEVWDVGNMKCRKAQLSKSKEKLSHFTLENSTGLDSFEDDSAENKSEVSLFPPSHSPVWTPWLFSRSVDNCVKKLTKFHRSQLSVHIEQRLPECDSSKYKIIPLRKLKGVAFQRFRVLWTGQVILRDKYGNWSEFKPGRFCVDGMVNFKSRHTRAGGPDRDYSGDFDDQVVVVCPDQMPKAIQKKPIPLRYALMLLLAAVILLMTGIISVLQWDRQNVYEWTVSCEVISMFFLIVFVGTAHTVARRPEKSDFGSAHCIFIGATSHFFWLATFFWLFIINFEIWWNFRSLAQLRKSRKWFRFCIYQLIGWGGPLSIVGLGLILDRVWGLQNEDLDCTDLIVPNYGQLNCYISKKAQGPYLFYPVGVILGCNLFFYLLTVFKMWGYRKKSEAILQHRSKSQTPSHSIFARLFLVMGVSWISEIVAWAVTTADADTIPLYWVVFDIVTLFQAVSFFWIFVWRKQVLTRLWYKFPSCQTFLYPFSKFPGCGIIPNDRDRMTSLHNTHQPPNKLPGENSVSARFHNLQTVSGTITLQQLPLASLNGYSYSANDVGRDVSTIDGNHSSSNSNNVSFSPQTQTANPQPHRMVVGSAEQITLSSV